jgi:hypothetical protein
MGVLPFAAPRGAVEPAPPYQEQSEGRSDPGCGLRRHVNGNHPDSWRERSCTAACAEGRVLDPNVLVGSPAWCARQWLQPAWWP